jgi:hypothetical protein
MHPSTLLSGLTNREILLYFPRRSYRHIYVEVDIYKNTGMVITHYIANKITRSAWKMNNTLRQKLHFQYFTIVDRIYHASVHSHASKLKKDITISCAE